MGGRLVGRLIFLVHTYHKVSWVVLAADDLQDRERDGQDDALLNPDREHDDALALWHPEHVGDLTGENLDPDTGEEADQHRRRQKVAEEAQPQQSGQDQEPSAHQGGEAAEGHPLR